MVDAGIGLLDGIHRGAKALGQQEIGVSWLDGIEKTGASRRRRLGNADDLANLQVVGVDAGIGLLDGIHCGAKALG